MLPDELGSKAGVEEVVIGETSIVAPSCAGELRRDLSIVPVTTCSARSDYTVPPMKSVIVGTAGHIDHGKTALVKALTGIDADRLEEEKRRGITIDIGFAHLDLTSRMARFCGWALWMSLGTSASCEHAGGRGRNRPGSAGDCCG